MGKIWQDIKSRLSEKRRYLEFRWLWYRMSQDERREWLQELRYLVWCQKHGRKVNVSKLIGID